MLFRFLIICLFSLTAYADDRPDGIIISLSEKSSVEVQEDLLLANLRIEKTANDPKNLQDEINTLMRKAFDIISVYDDVHLETQKYSVFHNYHNKNDKEKQEWRGMQSISLTSENKDKLLKLVGKLQEIGMVTTALEYKLSAHKRMEAYNNLLEPTIEQLRSKVKKIAKTLGKDEFEFLSLNIGPDHPTFLHKYSHDQLRSHASESTSLPPVVAPGKSTVSASVSAEVLIKE